MKPGSRAKGALTEESRVDMFMSKNRNVFAIALFVAMTAQAVFAQEAAEQKPATQEPFEERAAAASEQAAEDNSPVPAVETFHSGLIDIMKEAEALGFQGRIDRLSPLMGETFDLDFMASKTVGRHWRKLSAEDKGRWAEAFTHFTTANYAGRFTGFTGEKFVTLGVENAARGTRVVLTKIVVPDGEEVQLNYRLVERDGTWKIIDVYLNGTVSELALRRSEYSSALKREGFDQLLDSIETKIADLKKKGKSEG